MSRMSQTPVPRLPNSVQLHGLHTRRRTITTLKVRFWCCSSLKVSSIVIADIDEGQVMIHRDAKIPRLPTYATDMFKFR